MYFLFFLAKGTIQKLHQSKSETKEAFCRSHKRKAVVGRVRSRDVVVSYRGLGLTSPTIELLAMIRVKPQCLQHLGSGLGEVPQIT